jgi:hypothetical protein
MSNWSWSDLVREHGEEGAFALLNKQRGTGQYVANVAYGDPAERPRPTYSTYVQSHPCHTDLSWVMPWDAWAEWGYVSDRPVFPDNVWITNRAPLADPPRSKGRPPK